MIDTVISIDIGWQSRAVIGRYDPNTKRAPEISLDFLDAYENGVSRRHAVLLWRNDVLCILDLGSANGTWVNGVRLIAHQVRGLKDGDVIRVGNVQLRLRFDPSRKYPPTFMASLLH